MQDDHRYLELLRLVRALSDRVSLLEQRLGARPPATEAQAESKPPAESKPLFSFATPDIKTNSQGELESRIGGHWLNRIGIVAVLIGTSYFLKYAFDNQWVGPSGRVLAGILTGLAAMVWSEDIRRRGYATFSYSLKALGIGLLYLSLWASSQLYGLVSTTLAFVVMSSVTAACVGLALWQNAQIIASFALIGAFITPIALSTGQNNAIALFTYIAILDAGGLILMRYRPWPRILLGSFASTFILYSLWHAQYYTADQFAVAASGLTAFFLMFALVPFLLEKGAESNAILFLVVANASAYFLRIYGLLDSIGSGRAAAIPAVLLGAIYVVVAHRFSATKPRVLSNVHWIVGIALLIAAVPIGLESHWITIGWFVEAGGLVWVSRQTQNDFLKYLGGTALGLGVARLLVIDNFDVTRLVFNERMMTFAIGLAVLGFVAATFAASHKPGDRQALAVLVITINVLALFALNQEITDAWNRQMAQSDPSTFSTLRIIRDFAYSALWMTYGAGLMIVGFWKRSQFIRWQALFLIGLTVAKVFLYDTSSLDRGYRIASLIALGCILLATSFLYQRNWFHLREK